MLSRCGLFLLVFRGEVENCARNSRVDNLSRLQGWDVTAEGL